MLPPFLKHNVTRSSSSSKHRKSHSLLQPDMLSLELGSTTKKYHYNKEKKPPKRSTQRPWLKGLMALLFILFILTYIPFFRLDENNQSSSSRQSNQANHIERDQIILYRIIGNDLPPRHKEGQTLSNLQFILDHEPEFPNTRKIFLLNRIIDPVNEATIIRLLDSYHMDYIRVPFVASEYEQLDFQLEKFPNADFFHSDDYRRFSKVSKLRALDYTYHVKNLYAMNNNGGRNTAIGHGRSIANAKWIMPFDGNCYLSKNAFKEIKSQLDKYGKDTKYFVVPMTRLLNNSVLLNGLDERPKTPEEPQIIFRYDATEEYNLNMRYGRRSKLELLWRLGALENRRLNRPTVPWEPIERPYSKDKGNFKNIGWVFRLFSGNPSQEENKKEASSIRAFNRLMAIQSSLDNLDESIARKHFRHDRPFIYNEKPMHQLRYDHWTNSYEIKDAVDHLQSKADEILKLIIQRLMPLSSVTSSSSSGSSSASSHSNSEIKDELGLIAKNVTILTMANYFTGEEKYGRAAANLIRVHFLNEYAVEDDDEDEYNTARRIPDDSHLLDFLSDQGYYFPSLSRVSHVVPKYSNHNRILNTSDLTKTDVSSLLDSIRLLRQLQQLTHKEYIDLQAMMAEFLEYLVTSPTGIHLAQMTDHRGVLYDLQVTAMAAFTDDVRLFLRVANRCRMRIGKQFTTEGKQPYQESSTRGRLLLATTTPSVQTEWRAMLHYETLNLQYWVLLARGIQNSGIAKDIWHYTAANQAQISHTVVSHLKRYSEALPQLDLDDAEFVKSRLRPLAYMAHAAFTHSYYDGKLIENVEIRERTEKDRLWMFQHVTDFGERWDFSDQEEEEEEDNDNKDAHDILKLIQDDKVKGRLGIPPFWMLTSV
ncbi:alginate lyase-domain-containing protein [Cokeromyces recurvatus]|uniref:alginate lyase-domain-containing protein n=1 Tax=Cokeromyces recurvatus TaxID=90255 RepID=UPI002220DE6F|nr:alginate lyase-domain-containing protein [Cokeromyces recurvatus]KAI7902914.1 alginate lyase-domain-containing protein [Cokeromyces recurvatus]